jgi:replication initiation and membrane attachment protein DnaB
MKSVKISEKANLNVVKLSEKFRMSKQAFVSLILETVVVDDAIKLQARDIIQDEYGYNDEDVGQLIPDEGEPQIEFEIGDDEDEDTIEFEEEYEEIKGEIKGL